MFNPSLNFYLRLAWVYTAICWAVALYFRYHPTKKLGGLGQPLPNIVSLILPIVLFVPFSGLRTDTGDTAFYIHDFELMPADGKIDIAFGKETLYPMIADIVKETSDDAHDLIFITAVISLVPVLVILYKYSHPYDLSIYLFMATGYFGLSMNGIRQYCAAGILMLGTKYLFSQKKNAIIKYGIIVFIAWMFHESSWIMMFIFIFARRKAWKPSSFMMLFLTLIVLALSGMVMPAFNEALAESDSSYSVYGGDQWNSTEGGSSFIRVIISLVPVVIAYFSRAQIRRIGFIGDVLINIGFVNAALYIISTYNWIYARLAIYTSVYYIMLLSWVAYNGVQKKDRGLYYTVCVIMYYYYSTFLNYGIVNYISDRYFPGRKLF